MSVYVCVLMGKRKLCKWFYGPSCPVISYRSNPVK